VQYGRVGEFGIDGPAAFTCIFHLSSLGVALLGSTYNPPSDPPTRSSNDVTSFSKLPLAASYRRDRKPAVATTATADVVFYYFTYLPYDSSGGRCIHSFSVLFFCNILTMLHARTRPGGKSSRSYLRYVDPIIFLLFRHRYLHRGIARTAGRFRLSSSSWASSQPLPALIRKNVSQIFVWR